jgi:tetratricopeptide (TPR) repeat protein
MKKAAAVIVVLLVACSFASGQEYKGKGRLLGTVTDPDGKPLEGVRVKLVFPRAQQGFEVKTDKEGRWVAAWIRGGAWNIDFEKVGFAPKKISVEVQEFQKNPEIKLALQKVEGLVVTDDMRGLLEKGNSLFDQQKYEEARAAYEEILVKYPDAYPIYRNVGNCWFAQEKYDLAEQSYLKVLEKDPKNPDAMVLIGNCYANRGDTAKAFEWYAKVELDKISDPIVLYNIGTSYYNNAKFDEALRYYQKAVEKQKGFTDGLYQLGLTQLNLQKNSEAVATFEEYLKVDPDSQRAAQVRAFLDYLKK